MTLIKKHKLSFAIFILSVIATAIISSRLNAEQPLFPGNSSIVFYPYNDSSDGGNSISSTAIDSSTYIQLNYTLHQGFTYPYAGLSIAKREHETYIRTSEFESLKIKLTATKGTNVPISLMVYDEKYCKKNDDNSLITFQYIIHTSKDEEEFKINLNDFKIPEWWYNENKINEPILFDNKQHQVKTINIENCNLIVNDLNDEIKITAISLNKSSIKPYLAAALGTLIAIVFFVVKEFNSRKGNKIVLEYNSTKKDIESSKTTSVIDFIAANYNNSDLSISIIKYKLALSESKITEEIKLKTGLSFKQYLNDIRLHEAKVLLQSTELSISEIAYQVGYSNVSHFNRVFKSAEKSAPRDFRKTANM